MFQETYQPVYMNKARYIAITMMPALNQYSFEELRLGYLREAISKDTVRMTQRHDARYSMTDDHSLKSNASNM
jgi:hypothetical protein